MQGQQQIGDGVGGKGTHCCPNPLHGACGFVFRPHAQNGCHVLERNTALFVRNALCNFGVFQIRKSYTISPGDQRLLSIAYLQYAIVTPLTIFSRSGTAIARSVSALAMQGTCSTIDDVRTYGQLFGDRNKHNSATGT